MSREPPDDRDLTAWLQTAAAQWLKKYHPGFIGHHISIKGFNTSRGVEDACKIPLPTGIPPETGVPSREHGGGNADLVALVRQLDPIDRAWILCLAGGKTLKTGALVTAVAARLRVAAFDQNQLFRDKRPDKLRRLELIKNQHGVGYWLTPLGEEVAEYLAEVEEGGE